jgi:para-nitrobenzyl esterase
VTVIRTTRGKVKGVMLDGITSFHGVPYAAELKGSGWFSPPALPESWTSVRPASEAGPSAPQVRLSKPFDDLLTARATAGSHCLNLNVWTPSPGDTRAPVMVWIHGGAFSVGSGSDPWYDGSAFARDGVVCVTINYRLGPLGFGLFDELFPDLGSSANCGLHDQLAALRWVQDNIVAFGGDPGNVTVFGESAGAMSICALLASPDARGLFRRAICQSGNARQSLPRRIATGISGRLLERLDVRPGDSEALIAAGPGRITSAADELVSDVRDGKEQDILGDHAFNGNVFEPVVDGALLHSVPLEAIAMGSATDIDLMVGTNTEEWRFFRIGESSEATIDDVVSTVGRYTGASSAASVYEEYSTYLASSDPSDIRDAIETDRFFEIPALMLAGAQSRLSENVYAYRFAWRSPMLLPGGIGACHMLEIPFVFDRFDNPLARTLVGPDHPQSLADAVHEAWISFAIDGVPRSRGLPTWPRFDGARQLMRLDDPSVVEASSGAQRPMWRFAEELPPPPPKERAS